MTLLVVLHIAFTAAFCAVLWLVQLLVYPQFLEVNQKNFPTYHQLHMNRIAPVVGPLMLGEGVCAGISFIFFFKEQPLLQALSVLLFGVVTLMTFLVFVPLHSKLTKLGSPELLHRAISLNWLRTGFESLRLLVVMVSVLQVTEFSGHEVGEHLEVMDIRS